MGQLRTLAATIRAITQASGGSNGGTITPGEMFAAVSYTGDGAKMRKITTNVAGGDTWFGITEIPLSSAVIAIPHPAPGYIGDIVIVLAGGSGGAGAYWSPDSKSGTPGSGQVARWTYNAKGDEVSFTAQHVNYNTTTSTLTLTVVGGVNNGKTLCVGGGESNNGSYGAASAATDRTASSTLAATKTFSGACRPYNATISYSDSTSYPPVAPASYGDTITGVAIDGMTVQLLGQTSPGGISVDGVTYGNAHKVTPSGTAGTPNTGAVMIYVTPTPALVNPVSLLWTKPVSAAGNHVLVDSVRGPRNQLLLTTALSSSVVDANRALLPDGFLVGAQNNTSAVKYISYMFKKNANFFDIVTYTGDGNPSPRAIAHQLGSKPGMILVKALTGSANAWFVYHKSLGASYLGQLDKTNAFGSSTVIWGNIEPDGNVFCVNDLANLTGAQYVAYLFGDDTTASSMIRVGALTVSSGRNDIVDLGWEAQFVLCKTVNSVDGWRIVDVGRDFGNNGQNILTQSSSSDTATNGWIQPNPNGFALGGSGYAAGAQIVYMAVRRSQVKPTRGTQMFNTKLYTGNGSSVTVTGVGFSPDVMTARNRAGGVTSWLDRSRGRQRYASSASTNAQDAQSNLAVTSIDADGMTIGNEGAWDTNAANYVSWLFKRAPGAFDVTTWTGDGNTSRNLKHNLGVIPELVIAKASDVNTDWKTWQAGYHMRFNYVDAYTGPLPGGLAYGVSTDQLAVLPYNSTDVAAINAVGSKYFAYLFATLPGISKVGTYTGNGGAQNIDCGFSNGARFVMIKGATSPGTDWWVWDSTRGIIVGNEPTCTVNGVGAEITSLDTLDPLAVGFTVKQNVSTAVNAPGVTYTFVAFA